MSNEISQRSRTFYAIADDLATYFETLALAEEQLEGSEDPSERKALEDGQTAMMARIESLGAELAKKTDSSVAVLRRLAAEKEMLAREELRFTERRLVVERAEEWLKQYLMKVMRQTGMTSVRGEISSLRIQRNGGVLPVILTDPEKISDDLCVMSGWIRADTLCQMVRAACDATVEWLVTQGLASLQRIPRPMLIAERLKQPCAACNGVGKILSDPASPFPCEACKGTGCMLVEGAHFGQRGEHLRIT